jgi:UDP-2,4-diacetamido-2,4,6-trideoxy-beta-L-altropyranose hydrolase
LNFGSDRPGEILIRADCSPEIGTGHVMRCLALAQAWQDTGGKAIFLMAQSTPSILARLAAENCEVVTVSAVAGSDEDAAFTNEYASGMNAEWLVVDGYTFGGEYQEQLRSRERKLLCVDDAGKCDRYIADIVLNQNLTARQGLYPNCHPDAQLLLGPSFCLLRREFTLWRKWQREILAIGRKVLVILGGSTPTELGVRVIESLAGARVEGLRAIFVVGGSSPDTAALENCAARFRERISIRHDVSNMPELMAQADIAISAAGSTCWELCLLGLPSILLDVADNQTPVATKLERRGCALYAGSGSGVRPDHLANLLKNLLASHDKRRSMSVRSRELVDGLGAERVVSAMRGTVCEPLSTNTRSARA